MSNKLPVMPAKCATCPFREGGWNEVRDLLERRALSEGTPICHSTGRALSKRLRAKAHACRGARDFQIQLFAALGFIKEATDAAWDKKYKEINEARNTRTHS